MAGVSATAVVVGVIGHRDPVPSNLSEHEEQLTQVLNSIRASNPHSQLVVVTSLADGADRIAARVVSKLDWCRLVVFLPMKRDEYATDFDETSLLELDSFLRGADEVLVVKPGLLGQSRDALYETCANAITEVADICIAFWDGVPLGLQGGTSHTLSRMLSQEKGVLADSPIVWLDMPRGGEMREVARPRLLSSGVSNPLTAGINDKFSNLKDVLNSRLPHPLVGHSGLPDVFEALDGLANQTQGRYRKYVKQLFVIGFAVAAAIGTVFTIPNLVSAVTALMAAAVLGWRWRKFSRSNLKNQYESYRLLSETTRLEILLIQSGSEFTICDHFLAAEDPELVWMRKVLAWNSIRDRAARTSSAEAAEVVAQWLDSQVDYLLGSDGSGGAVERNRNKHTKSQSRSRLPLGMAAFAILAQLVISSSLWSPDSTGIAVVQLLWEFGIAGFAAVVGYAEVMAFGDVSNSLEAKARLLEHIQFELTVAKTREQRDHLLSRLANSTLSELENWYAMNRNRAVRPI